MSKIDIFNLALGLVGEYKVTSTDTDKKEFQICDRFLPEAVKEVQSKHPWRETTKRALVLAHTERPTFGYQYQYAVPSGCLAVLNIGDDLVDWKVEQGYILSDYTVMPDQWQADRQFVAGQYIIEDDITWLCNTPHTSDDTNKPGVDGTWTTQTTKRGYIRLMYSVYLADITKWSQIMKSAIVELLAVKVITALVNDPKAKRDALEVYETLTLPRMRSLDSRQGKPDSMFQSSWLRSRR